MSAIEGIDGLEDIVKKLQLHNNFLQMKNGSTYDAKNAGGFLQGPLLHQDSAVATEEESAQFEREYPEVIQHLLHLKYELEKLLES